MAGQRSIVGKPLAKVDGPAKVTGQARFADDLALPRMLYGKLLRSPHAHARILSIDASRALALPGVYAVLTGQDVPVKYAGLLVAPAHQDLASIAGPGPPPPTVARDETALAVERVRYVGEAVAAVAAVDEETAAEALKLIRVDYEPLPSILTVEEATRPDAIPIHEGGNVHRAHSFEYGDVEEGFAQAEHVWEDLFFYQGSNHLALEEHAALAHYDPAAGKLTLWTSTQMPHHIHRLLAEVLQLPFQRVRVVAPPVGGGFGGKVDLFSHEVCAAKLAMATGRPVKITLTRQEVFYAHRGRHPTLMWIKTGLRRDGSITAMHLRCILDGGAYTGHGPITAYYASGVHLPLTYRIPRYKIEGMRVYTNKPASGPKRGMGNPQARLALEVQLDKVAHALGLDPVEMRLRQLMPPNSLTINYMRITSSALRACIDKVAEASGWSQKHGQLPYGQGIGFACGSFLSGTGINLWQDEANMPYSSVHLRVDRLGHVALSFGTADIGQGSDTVLAAVVAEVLGLEPSEIRLVTGDTDLTPVDMGAFSSRITFMGGNAALEAAERIAGRLRRAAAAKLELAEDALLLGGGRIYDRENPEVGLAFGEAARLAEAADGPLEATGSYRPPVLGGPYPEGRIGTSATYVYSACVAQVAVSPRTGEVKVEKVWLAHDCGQAINPLLVEGQAEGCIYMGLGEALLEEQSFRKGLHKAPSMLEYKSPTILETPELEVLHVESRDPEGPYGAKEAGEGPIVPVMPAVVNAVYDAVGVRIDEVPVTPEKVLKALEDKAKGGQGRYGPARFPPVVFPETRHVEPPPQWRRGEYGGA